MNPVRFVILWLMAAFMAPDVAARHTNLVFSNAGTEQKLSSSWVTALCRDRQGYMWVGTNRGLNRFDGYYMSHFTAVPGDSLSLTNNHITAIAEDPDSNLWIGTSYGVNIKPPGSHLFRQVSLFDHNAFNCNDVNNINDIFVSGTGKVYLGTHQGFFTYHNGVFRHFLIDSLRTDADVNNVFCFAEDTGGSIWMGTNTFDLIRLDPGGWYERIGLPALFEGKYVQGLQKMLVDSDQRLWIGSQSGMYVYDIRRGQWDDEMNRFLSQWTGNTIITGIAEENSQTIWITTDGAGLFLYDKQEGSMTRVVSGGSNRNGISSDGLFCLHIDYDQIVWIGTFRHGLDFYRKSSKGFRLIHDDPNSPEGLRTSDVNCFMEDAAGILWIGTNGGGVNIYDRESGKFRYLTEENSGLSSNVIVSLCQDHMGHIWIGTYFGGLNRFDPATGRITVYKHDTRNPESLSDDRIWSITEDAAHNLWIGTLGGGVNRFDPRTGKFERFQAGNSGIAGNYVNHVTTDRQQNIWVATTDGLSIISPGWRTVTGKTDTWMSTASEPEYSNFGKIISTYHDSRGWSWLCTSNGLIRFNPVTGSQVMMGRISPLLSDAAHRVLEDGEGNLWMSGAGGLARISLTTIKNETEFGVDVFRFDETDGLQGREFSETAALKLKSGEMVFGGVNGLNIFNPAEIDIDHDAPRLIFTHLRIFNKLVNPGEPFNNRVILQKPVSQTSRIVLRHSENLFTIEFAALTFINTSKNKYKYKLEGFDDTWFETDGDANFATFTNLNNGSYVLRVTGSNADGVWNEEGISMEIRVLPPFWKSWYAILLYVVLLSSLLFALRYLILSRERMKVELEKERDEAQRVHELDMAKLKFITNISHELRTPLSLILSPVESLLPRFRNLPEEKYLQHIWQNTRKLINMINRMLDFRKMESQGLSYNPTWGNIVEFISDTIASFYDLSENKQIELRQITDLREFYMMFDREKMEGILFNLLSNAFKFTPISGLVVVQVSLEESVVEKEVPGTWLTIRVKDNGIGIPSEELDKIFTRFYQVDRTDDNESRGSGIGLSLAKEYALLHGGRITVESARNIGTCFTVYLPVEMEGEGGPREVTDYMKETRISSRKETRKAAEAMANRKRPLVLVVEDNESLRQYVSENLEDQYEVAGAEHGKSALNEITRRMPDLIVCDIMMPVMDGIEFCKIVKGDKLTSHIPFIFLTAKASDQHKLEGLKTGADDYMEKPFNLEILKTKIRNLLMLKARIREVFRSKINIEPKDIGITSLDEKFMSKALDVVESHMDDVHFSVEAFSREMGMSRMQLYNKIFALTGVPPLEFIRSLRLKRAARLLTEGQLNVSEVAYQVGFNDPKYFSQHFKKMFGVNPSVYDGKN